MDKGNIRSKRMAYIEMTTDMQNEDESLKLIGSRFAIVYIEPLPHLDIVRYYVRGDELDEVPSGKEIPQIQVIIRKKRIEILEIQEIIK